MNQEERMENERARIAGDWYRTRWYRVVDEAGKLWGETSDLDEARECMRPGDTLQLLWAREDTEWRDE